MNEVVQEWVDKAEADFASTDLLALCLPLDRDFKKVANDLSSLEGYAVAIRYPGATISVKLAEEAFKAVNRVRKFVRSKLGIR